MIPSDDLLRTDMDFIFLAFYRYIVIVYYNPFCYIGNKINISIFPPAYVFILSTLQNIII